MRHADAIVTGEAETIWPAVCEDLLAGKLKERYTGSPTPSLRMVPVDYRFFGDRLYQTPASLFATRGCNHRCSFCVSSRYMGPLRTKPLDVLEREIDQLQDLFPKAFRTKSLFTIFPSTPLPRCSGTHRGVGQRSSSGLDE